MSLNRGLYQSRETEWETPRGLFLVLDAEFHFTLDACASRENTKCPAYYSREEDGLVREWSGVVWMNPPYGREIKTWVKKAFQSAGPTCKVVCLLPVRSDTRWWHEFVMKASEIRLMTRRLSFEGSTNKAPFPACIVIFNGETGPIISPITV